MMAAQTEADVKSTILIVDDNEDNRCVLVDALEDEGYELREACDGIQALAAVAEEPPDAILLDVMMPEMDGIECCRRLQADQRFRHIPIILVTALSEDQHVIDGLNAGATDYIGKPFAGPVVRARIAAALRSKHAHDELDRRNREIRRLAEALERKNAKLADMTETAHRFVDNVAHEFRTPLAVIREFSSIIADGLGGSVTDTQLDYLRFISNATGELAQMVDDFLDSSKLKACTLRVDRREQAVADILAEARPLLTARAQQKQVSVTEEIDPATPAVFVDGEKVRRVLVNLAVNAIKFSPEGAEVLIWARPEAGGGAEIGVTDRGPGLSPEDVATVFQRFKQVGDVERASTKGFGLGLNIAKELIWLNLGTANVSSEPGQGSTFSFTLPPCHSEVILDRYLERLGELDEPPTALVLLRASAPPMAGEPLRSRLVSICHPTDLGLVAGDAASVLLLGSTKEPKRWVARLERTMGDTPHLELECLGSYSRIDDHALRAVFLDHLGKRCACA